MKLYSDLAPRRTAQVVGDLATVAWVVLWWGASDGVREATLVLAEPGRRLSSAGSSFRGAMDEAAGAVDNLPLVEDAVAAPFRRAAGVGTEITTAGTDLVASVQRLADVLGWVTFALPAVLALLAWVAVRGRFIRRASAAQRFIDGAPDLDLFALRAMARQPMARLARVSADPAGDWRRRDPEVVRALAALELRSCGLEPPAR